MVEEGITNGGSREWVALVKNTAGVGVGFFAERVGGWNEAEEKGSVVSERRR